MEQDRLKTRGIIASREAKGLARRAEHSVLSTQYLVLSTRCSGGRYNPLSSLLFLATITNSLLFVTTAAGEPKIDPVKSAKDALTSGGRFPWYDRKQDGVRRLSIVPREAPGDRGPKWASTPQPTTTTTKNLQLPRMNLVSSALQWLGLTLLIVLLGVIAYLIAVSFLKDEISDGESQRKVVEVRRDVDRVEALPFKVRAATTDFLAEARRLYDAGQYSEAIIYLFSHELVELDKHQVIRLAKGKTNRQYLRETRRRPHLAGVLETTMVAFEDAFFGNKQLSRDVFEQSWSRLNEFELELERQELAAA